MLPHDIYAYYHICIINVFNIIHRRRQSSLKITSPDDDKAITLSGFGNYMNWIGLEVDRHLDSAIT